MSVASNKRILIVEDEPDVVDLLSLQLRKAGGVSATTAQDGAEGWKKARADLTALIWRRLLCPRLAGL